MDAQQRQAYWRENLTIMGILLAIWALVSYGAGILFVDQLNNINVPIVNVPMGFWFAQQGSIVIFVILIFIYVKFMDRLDKKYGVEEYEQEVHHS
ncbi:MAG: DUF4212 domain-containing protein [Actinomycetia bacterium]|nr:DUF4212 domain-containing protein [Actinomycetes bacterium]